MMTGPVHDVVQGACVLVMPDGTRIAQECDRYTVTDWRELSGVGMVNFGYSLFGPWRSIRLPPEEPRA